MKKVTLLALAWPILIEMLLQILIGNTDTFMLSHLSDDAVAAVGLVNQFLGIIVILFGVMANGTGVVVAQYVGANDEKRANIAAMLAIWVNLLLSMAASVGILLFDDAILRIMNVDAELYDMASTYLRWVGGFSFIPALVMTMGAIVRSNGNTRIPMMIAVGMNLVHIFGNYLFIFSPFGIPQLGVFGVSISTIFSRLLAAIVFIYVLKHLPGIRFRWRRLFQWDRSVFKQIVRIGGPSAGENGSWQLSQLLITTFIAQMGAAALATRVYVSNLESFSFLISVALGQAGMIMVGQLVGGQKIEEASRTGWRAYRLGLATTIAATVVIVLSARSLLSLFTNNQSIIDTGTKLLMLTLLLQIGKTTNIIVIALLRAAGDAKFPFLVGVLVMWGVFVPLAYYLGVALNWGLWGIWLAMVVDEWLRGMIMVWRWHKGVWKQKSFTKEKIALQES